MHLSFGRARGLAWLAAGAVLTLGFAAPTPSGAATVASSLPYEGTPDWTDVVFGGTSMTTNGTVSTLSTANYRGVWFGWSGANTPSWTPGNNAAGNYLSLDASFSSNAADWSAYFYDETHYAAMIFNPTGCNLQDCYTATPQAGVAFYFSDGVGGSKSKFVALDTTKVHTYEFLLKNGQVSYRVDGVAYTDSAYATSGGKLLVIGDGSGSTGTGVESMFVHGAALDNAPTFNALESTAGAVPEPAAWTLMIGGFGLAGAAMRLRRRTLATA